MIRHNLGKRSIPLQNDKFIREQNKALNCRKDALKRGCDLVTGDVIRRDALFKRDGGKCQICGTVLLVEHFEMDHIIPLSKGGTHTWDNVQVTCFSCNNAKGADLPC